MKIRLDTIIAATLVICAVITTGVVLRREFIAPAAAPGQAGAKPVLISHWRDNLTKGTRLGTETAPVQIIEFADFECPFCASFHKTMKTMLERFPTQLALT